MVTHTWEKLYQCSLCDKVFSPNGNLTRHMRSQTGGKPYRCNQCDETFSYKIYLNYHTRIHTGDRPYQCTQCERVSDSSSLKYHTIIHSGETPYQCSQCDKPFSYNPKLTRIHTGDRRNISVQTVWKCILTQ